MNLKKLLDLAEIGYDLCDEDTEIEKIVPDSTRIERGDLFIAIEGVKIDGHQFVSRAIERGASAVIVSKNALLDGRVRCGERAIPLVAVDDCREAMARLYAAYYGNPQNAMKFVGVTGTNGKTSVCRILYEILTRAGKKCGLIGTAGCYIGERKLDIRPENPLANMTTPDPEELYRILDVMRCEGVEIVIMEVTSHALALSKVAPITFELGIFTNLSEDHLDFHSDMEDYFNQKYKLFLHSRQAIINFDDKYGKKIKSTINIPTYSCSAEDGAVDFLATDVRCKDECGIEYKLSSPHIRLRLRSRLMGRFNVMNTLEASVASLKLGVSPSDVKEALASFCGIDGRLERLKLDGRVEFSVYVDYAHTPDALENLLRTVRSFARRGQRIVLLFGCGGDRDKYKRAIMGRVATSMADFVIVTSDNSRSERPIDIISDIVAGIDYDGHYTVIEDRRDAIEYAIKNAHRGDIILLAGKGHEVYEIDSSGRKPFSEKEIVREFVSKYYF